MKSSISASGANRYVHIIVTLRCYELLFVHVYLSLQINPIMRSYQLLTHMTHLKNTVMC